MSTLLGHSQGSIDNHLLYRMQYLEQEMVKMRLASLGHSQLMHMQMSTLAWNNQRPPIQLIHPFGVIPPVPTVPLDPTPRAPPHQFWNKAPQQRYPVPTISRREQNPVHWNDSPSKVQNTHLKSSIPYRADQDLTKHQNQETTQVPGQRQDVPNTLTTNEVGSGASRVQHRPGIYRHTNRPSQINHSHKPLQKRTHYKRGGYQAPRHMKSQQTVRTHGAQVPNIVYHQVEHATPKTVRFMKEKQVINISDVSKLSTPENQNEFQNLRSPPHREDARAIVSPSLEQHKMAPASNHIFAEHSNTALDKHLFDVTSACLESLEHVRETDSNHNARTDLQKYLTDAKHEETDCTDAGESQPNEMERNQDAQSFLSHGRASENMGLQRNPTIRKSI